MRHAQGSSVSSGASWTDGGGARTHTVGGLTNNRQYGFEVRAVNGVTVHAYRTTVETDTTFALTWNGRPTDELHPDNPTQLTIKAGECCARTSLAAAADSDDPRVYNQPVKGDVVAKLGSLTLMDDLIVRDDEPLPKVSLSATDTVEEGAAFRVRATLAHRLDVNTTVPFHRSGAAQIRGRPEAVHRLYFGDGERRWEHRHQDADHGIHVPDDEGDGDRGLPHRGRVGEERRQLQEHERDADMTFTVSLSFADENATYTVDYATAAGAARAGSDYTATSGTLTFAPGEHLKEVAAPVLDDAVEEPANLRILKVYDDSMAPDIREGDRVVIDLSHRQPAGGGTFMLRLGDELVVRQVEAVEEDEPPRIRLIAANPGYAPSTCLARDVRVIGKVVWVVRRV